MTMIIKASLIFCASFSAIILLEIPQGNCQVLKLDMAPNAFNDQYVGCEVQMYEKVRSTGLLQEELCGNSNFSKQWSEAVAAWPEKKKNISLPAGFRDEYGIAIVAYTGNLTYKEFNNAVSEGFKSSKHYMNNFHFKSLHFYLTMGLRLLRENCTSWKTVYRGSKVEFEPESDKIRFGRFTSTSLNRTEAEKFGKKSFFTIETRLGVKIEAFSFYPNQFEVLIPLNEEFKVTQYTSKGEFNLTGTESRTCSEYNCVYVNDGKAECQSQYCICNSSPGGASVMTSLLFGGVLVILSTAML